MAGIATFSLVALDTPDPVRLARFYAELTGWAIRPYDEDGDDWIELEAPTGATITFQLAPDHVPPRWPDAAHPQQLHLDFDVPDLDEGERQVLAIGAVKPDTQPAPTSFRVYVDPAGHPFCLVKAD